MTWVISVEFEAEAHCLLQTPNNLQQTTSKLPLIIPVAQAPSASGNGKTTFILLPPEIRPETAMHIVASTSMVLMQPKANTGENRTQTSPDIQASQKNPVKAETEVSNTTGTRVVLHNVSNLDQDIFAIFKTFFTLYLY